MICERTEKLIPRPAQQFIHFSYSLQMDKGNCFVLVIPFVYCLPFVTVLMLYYIACIKDCSVCHFISVCASGSSWGIRSVWMPGPPAVSRVCLALPRTLSLAGWAPVLRRVCRACWEHSRDLELRHREKTSPPHSGSHFSTSLLTPVCPPPVSCRSQSSVEHTFHFSWPLQMSSGFPAFLCRELYESTNKTWF